MSTDFLIGCDRCHNTVKQFPFESLAFINIANFFYLKIGCLYNMTILALTFALI